MSNFAWNMTAESFYYAIVISLTLFLAWLVRSVRVREIIYLLASYVLYATWGLTFLGLLIFSSLVNYALGIWLKRRLTAARLWIGIAFNLTFLGTYKYLPGFASLAFAAFVNWPVFGTNCPAGWNFFLDFSGTLLPLRHLSR